MTRNQRHQSGHEAHLNRIYRWKWKKKNVSKICGEFLKVWNTIDASKAQNMTQFLGELTKIEICDIVYAHRLYALWQYRLSNYIACLYIFVNELFSRLRFRSTPLFCWTTILDLRNIISYSHTKYWCIFLISKKLAPLELFRVYLSTGRII